MLYTAAAIGAFGGVSALSGLLGLSGGLPRFGEITATYAEFLWVVPCLVFAYLMTLLFHASNLLFGNVSARFGQGALATVAPPVIAGIVMGSVAVAHPCPFPGSC